MKMCIIKHILMFNLEVSSLVDIRHENAGLNGLNRPVKTG